MDTLTSARTVNVKGEKLTQQLGGATGDDILSRDRKDDELPGLLQKKLRKTIEEIRELITKL